MKFAYPLIANELERNLKNSQLFEQLLKNVSVNGLSDGAPVRIPLKLMKIADYLAI